MWRRFSILMIVLAIIFCVASPVFSKEDLKLTVEIDDEIYEVEDDITINLIWENVGGESFYFLPWGYPHATDYIRIKNKKGDIMEYNPLICYARKLFPKKDDYILLKSKEHYRQQWKGRIKKERLERLAIGGKSGEGMFINFGDSVIFLTGPDLYIIYAEYGNNFNTYFKDPNHQIPINAWVGSVESSNVAKFILVEKKEVKIKKEISRTKAIQLANKKATEMGYKIKEMSISVTKVGKGKFWKVYYSPLKLQLGGDLSVYIDARDGAVRDIIRGE